jgi:hypothetical protein
MKCSHCRKEIPEGEGVLINMDGDFVHKKCKESYEKDRKEFFENIHKDEWFAGYMKGENLPPPQPE